MKGIIKLVFDKATSEPKFCAMYAELCRKLAENTPTFAAESEGGKPTNFKRLLLNQCQEEFEASFKPAPAKPEELSREEKLKSEEEQFLAKKRMLGSTTCIL